jgi:hypothetical protein
LRRLGDLVLDLSSVAGALLIQMHVHLDTQRTFCKRLDQRRKYARLTKQIAPETGLPSTGSKSSLSMLIAVSPYQKLTTSEHKTLDSPVPSFSSMMDRCLRRFHHSVGLNTR